MESTRWGLLSGSTQRFHWQIMSWKGSKWVVSIFRWVVISLRGDFSMYFFNLYVFSFRNNHSETFLERIKIVLSESIILVNHRETGSSSFWSSREIINNIIVVAVVVQQDYYILSSMAMLCSICVWHAIAHTVYLNDTVDIKYVDKYVLIVLGSFYLVGHISFILIVYFGVKELFILVTKM